MALVLCPSAGTFDIPTLVSLHGELEAGDNKTRKKKEQQSKGGEGGAGGAGESVRSGLTHGTGADALSQLQVRRGRRAS